MRYFVRVGERGFEVDLGAEGICVDGTHIAADLSHVPDTLLTNLLLDGRSFRILAEPGDGAGWTLHLRGRRYEVEAVDERTHAVREMTGGAAKEGGARPIRAPMPGLVVRVEVKEGDRVEAGQGVVIVEAMKMENELRADATALVARVHIRAGQTVEKGQLLIDMETPEPGGEDVS